MNLPDDDYWAFLRAGVSDTHRHPDHLSISNSSCSVLPFFSCFDENIIPFFMAFFYHFKALFSLKKCRFIGFSGTFQGIITAVYSGSVVKTKI